MYTVCRVYSNAKELAELIIANKAEVESLLRSVPGFQAYYLVLTGDGFTTITVCEDQAGTEESSRRAADWVRARAGGMQGTIPQIFTGPTLISFPIARAAVNI